MERQQPPHLDTAANGCPDDSDDGTLSEPDSDSDASDASDATDAPAPIKGKAARRSKRKKGKKTQEQKDRDKAGSKRRKVEKQHLKADASKVTRAAGEGVGSLVADWIRESPADYVATILSLLNEGDIVESVLLGMLRTMHLKKDFNIDEAKAAFVGNPNVFFGGLLDTIDTAVQADKIGDHAYFVEQFLHCRKLLKQRAAMYRKASKLARKTLYVDIVEDECRETRKKCIGKTAWSTYREGFVEIVCSRHFLFEEGEESGSSRQRHLSWKSREKEG